MLERETCVAYSNKMHVCGGVRDGEASAVPGGLLKSRAEGCVPRPESTRFENIKCASKLRWDKSHVFVCLFVCCALT